MLLIKGEKRRDCFLFIYYCFDYWESSFGVFLDCNLLVKRGGLDGEIIKTRWSGEVETGRGQVVYRKLRVITWTPRELNDKKCFFLYLFIIFACN